MEVNSLVECIEFFNELTIQINDITEPINRVNDNKVVVVTYKYKGKEFVTSPLYYKEITTLNDVRNTKELHDYFGSQVYWLDIKKHQWPKGSGESDIDKLIIDDMLPDKNDKDFKEFLLLLANNNQTGFIQKITKDGRTAQYYHNLENNNHWHDIIIWIKESIKKLGNPIDKSFFSHLIFNWDKGKRTSLNLNYPYKIVTDLNSNLKKIKPIMDFQDKIKVLLNKKQIILQGPPGTGKTYTAKDIAYKMIFNEELSHQKDYRTEQLKKLESLEQFKLVQFHPSYSYEDFVRGIVAKPNPDGEGIVYEAENKTLGHFAKLALDNYLASQGIQNTNSDFENRLKILLEEINNKIDLGETYRFADKSTAEIISIGSDYLIYSFPNRLDIRYKLLFSDIEKIYNKRTDIKIPIDLRDKEKELQLEMKGKYPYYFMILEKLKEISNIPSINNKVEELKNYILIIDEINRSNLPSVLGELIYALEYRGSEVSSMYEVNGKKTIIIPENLFIIGTMNTADRSVGHIDYAIRRRFAFVNILPNNSVIENAEAKALFEEISNLFESKDTLASDFKKDQVRLGHSYFIVKDEEELKMKAKYEIVPILEEYLKDGILLEKAEKTILDLKERFGA